MRMKKKPPKAEFIMQEKGSRRLLVKGQVIV